MISNDTTGLAAERRERVAEILRERHIVRVDELCRELGVSAATVRRDLARLEQSGHVRRVHGGAVSARSQLEEPLFDDKTDIARKEKQAIADAALRYIGSGDSIFLDGGSTLLTLARMVIGMTGVTVVTNSLRAAGVLAVEGPRVILVGGELRRRSQTFVGPLTSCVIEQIHVDTAFMGTIGLSAEKGLTTTDPREAYTKSLILKHANRVVLLADSSKVGKVSFVRFGDLGQVDALVTDSGLPQKSVARLKKEGVDVVLS